MTKEERELSIEYLEKIKEDYIEGNAYERHPLPEYYAIENAIKALEQEPKPMIEIDLYSVIKQKYIEREALDKISAEIQRLRGCSCSCSDGIIDDVEDIIDKYKAESEEEPPIVDTQPVIHAKWIFRSGAVYDEYICSNCNKRHIDYATNYCPNCGAKMESEE